MKVGMGAKMWILLFTSVFAVAICLSVLAIIMSPIGQDSSVDRRYGPREFAQDAPKPIRRAYFDLQRKNISLRTSEDVRLLLRRMTLLDLAPDRVNDADPLLFRELQGRCSLCPSKVACARDLAQEVAGGHSDKWREYCPNAATLASLRGRLQGDLLSSTQAH